MTARAAPLDQAACDAIKQDLSALERGGSRAAFDKGAAWAKANLKPEQIALVERLLDAEAQFLFRCPQPKRSFDAATEALLENGTPSDPDPDAPKPEATATPAKSSPAPKAKRTNAAKPKPSDALVPDQPRAQSAGSTGGGAGPAPQ
jgi:hypothetical protein